MKSMSRVLAVLLMFSTPALAAPKKKGKKRAKTTTSSAKEGSSAYNRENKKVSLLLNFSQASTGYFLTPNLIIHGTYQFSEFNVAKTISSFRTNTSYSRFGVNLDYFLGNSFYAMGGLSQQSATYEQALSFLDDHPPHSVTYEDVGLDVGIGNRWQWGVVALSCQWFGIHMPLSKSEPVYTLAPDNPQSQEDYIEKEEADRAVLQGNSYYFADVSIGFAF